MPLPLAPALAPALAAAFLGVVGAADPAAAGAPNHAAAAPSPASSTTAGGEVVGGGGPRGIPTTVGDAAPGQLLWAQRFRTLNAGQVRAAIGDAGFDPSGVRVGVDLWRVVYATTDPSGARVTASGLVALPRSDANRLTTVLIEQGTLAYRGDAPSVGANPFVLAAPLQAAGAGYLVVSPDYLGLGYGAGTHPYLHIPSEVSASVDLLTATRRLLDRTERAATGDLLVGGFSQGGPAALAVARHLEATPPAGWRVRAVAPISGPYAIVDVQIPAMLRGEVPGYVAAYYTTYALTATDKVRSVYAKPAEVFRRPYAGRAETLFGSNVPESEIIAALPGDLDSLLTPRGMALVRDPTGPFARAMAANDRVCAWSTRVPVRLFRMLGDEQVPAANTEACARQFRAKGVNARIVNLSPRAVSGSLHLGSGVDAAAATLAWFQQVSSPAAG